MSRDYLIPKKIRIYLERVRIDYSEHEREHSEMLRQIISKSRFYVEVEVHSDNWDGGIYFHDLCVFAPREVLKLVALDTQEKLREELKEALEVCSKSITDEFIRDVFIELGDRDDQRYRDSFSLDQGDEEEVEPEALALWPSGHIRMFISHRDGDKKEAADLAEALEVYGISCFVAHDDIRPAKSWPKEIVHALKTMDVMLLFVTSGFHKSFWVNQEIGFALGRGTLIVPLKLSQTDPKGFAGSIQAVTGKIEYMQAAAKKVYSALLEEDDLRQRLQGALIRAFVESENFNVAIKRLREMEQRIESLSTDELNMIKRGFAENDQLHGCNVVNWDLPVFLRRVTKKAHAIKGKVLIIAGEDKLSEDNIPF